MPENQKPMKEQLLELVEGIRKDRPDIDLTETPVIFTWMYEEEPDLEFSLMIQSADESELETATVH